MNSVDEFMTTQPVFKFMIFLTIFPIYLIKVESIQVILSLSLTVLFSVIFWNVLNIVFSISSDSESDFKICLNINSSDELEEAKEPEFVPHIPKSYKRPEYRPNCRM